MILVSHDECPENYCHTSVGSLSSVDKNFNLGHNLTMTNRTLMNIHSHHTIIFDLVTLTFYLLFKTLTWVMLLFKFGCLSVNFVVF